MKLRICNRVETQRLTTRIKYIVSSTPHHSNMCHLIYFIDFSTILPILFFQIVFIFLYPLQSQILLLVAIPVLCCYDQFCCRYHHYNLCLCLCSSSLVYSTTFNFAPVYCASTVYLLISSHPYIYSYTNQCIMKNYTVYLHTYT